MKEWATINLTRSDCDRDRCTRPTPTLVVVSPRTWLPLCIYRIVFPLLPFHSSLFSLFPVLANCVSATPQSHQLEANCVLVDVIHFPPKSLLSISHPKYAPSLSFSVSLSLSFFLQQLTSYLDLHFHQAHFAWKHLSFTLPTCRNYRKFLALRRRSKVSCCLCVGLLLPSGCLPPPTQCVFGGDGGDVHTPNTSVV